MSVQNCLPSRGYARAVDPIGSLLLGKALDVVLRGGKAAAKRFFDSPPTVRLLWLLYEQHGEEADLGKDAFVAWDVDASLRTELESLIDGRSDAAAAPSILAPLIEPYLVRTPPAERRALAESIARSAARAAPYVVETLQEATGAIVARTERIGEGLLAALNARDRDGALTRALVQGPLEITGQTQTAADAERLVEAGEPSEAADRYLEVAAALDDHQLAVAAEAYRERAAMLLYEAGDPARAAPLLVQVGRARARRGSDLAGSTARSLREAPGAVAAVVGGVEALHDWPLDPDGAIAALRAAVEASSGEERIRWLADLVGLMSIFEPADAVLATTGDLDAPLAPGARLELELDLLDAVEVIEGVDEAETRWAHLLDWVDTRAGAAERGLAWQRRGVCLARRGDSPAAETAFRKAMAQWAQSSAGGEQVADGLYSLQAAMALNGGYPGDPEDRILAAELRGPGESEAARAEMLTQWGMRSRIRGKLPDALRKYWHAYAIARRSGSLVSRVEVAETLAELFAETGREGIALSLLIDAGRGERAGELAKALPGEVIALALRPHGARWERGATWHVVAAVGRRLPADAARDLLPLVLAASREASVGFGPPALPARRALAALAPFAEGDLLDEVLEQLRHELQGPPFDQRKAAAEALVLATNAGIADATEDLLRAFVADPWNIRGVRSGWLKERLEAQPELAGIVRPGALEGSLPLLALLVEAGLVEGDAELEAACTKDAQATAQIQTVREGEGQAGIDIGVPFHLSGITARCAAGPARTALLARMLEIARDSRDSEENRAVAVAAVDNLAPALTPEQASEGAQALEPLAIGDYPASLVDENLDDPLSPTQIRLHTPHVLRAAAIAALAEIAAAHPELDRQQVVRALTAGLRDGPEIVAAAALGALGDSPDIQSPIPLEQGLLAPDRQIREAALVAWLRREGSLPDDHYLETLLRDPDDAIRWRVLVAASKDPDRGPALLKRIAQEDPDVYFRLVARWRATDIGQPA
jgi:hypothetical protein